MASQGPNSPGTASESGTESANWQNLNNILSSNDLFSNVGSSISGNTRILKATNFGFSIPSGATIDGILVEIERRKSSTLTGVKDVSVKIIKADGSIGTTNKADTALEWPTTDTIKSYGGSSDKWGESWTDSNINDTDFGVSLQTSYVPTSKSGSSQPRVDHIRITIYYTEGGGGSSAIKSINGLAKASVKSVNGLAIASVKNINGLA